MGANEKHGADHGGEYTPDVDDLRDLWVDRKLDPLPRAQGIELVPTVQAAFDGWLEQVRAEAKQEALNEVANAFQYKAWSELIQGSLQDRLRVAQPITAWLRARANQYKENQ